MKQLIKTCAIFLFVGLLTSACGNHHKKAQQVVPLQDQPVALDVEVYDPVSDLVWQDVGVRIVQGDVEATGCLCPSPLVDDWFYTDLDGLVYFAPEDLAFADIGFLEDNRGRAIVGSSFDEDEAYVLLEVWAPGLQSVFWEVKVTWDDPVAVISIPFEGFPIPVP